MPNNDKALQIVEKLQQKSQRLFGNELETSTGDLLNSMEQHLLIKEMSKMIIYYQSVKLALSPKLV